MNKTYISLHHADFSHPPPVRFLVIGSGKDLEKQRQSSTDQCASKNVCEGPHNLLTSTSSPSPISFFSSEGGGNLTSPKGTWRSGCHLKGNNKGMLNGSVLVSSSFLKTVSLKRFDIRRNTHLFSKAMVTESLWISLTKPCRSRMERRIKRQVLQQHADRFFKQLVKR